MVKLNFILVYPCRFLAIVVSDNEFKTKKNVILFRDKIEPQRVQHLPMCACFVIYDYYPSYTDNILHSKRLTYWKYIYCLFFLLFRRKKNKRNIYF